MVHAGVRHVLAQQGVQQRREIADFPEQFGQRNLGEEPPGAHRLHELAAAHHREQREGAGARVNTLIVQVPQRVHIPLHQRGERLKDAPHQLFPLPRVHAQVRGVAVVGEFFLKLLHAQVDHTHPFNVLRHAVEVFLGGV